MWRDRLATLMALLAVMSGATLSVAYPTNWQDILEGSTGDACTSHPQGPWGSHAAPIDDRNLTFTVTPSNGAPTTSICPNASVIISFGTASKVEAWFTASAGTLSGMTRGRYSKPGGCVGARHTTLGLADRWNHTLVANCSELANRTQVTLKFTYATGTGGGFRIASVNLSVGGACFAAACIGPPSGPPCPRLGGCFAAPDDTTCCFRNRLTRQCECVARCASGFTWARSSSGGWACKRKGCATSPAATFPEATWPAGCIGSTRCVGACKDEYKPGNLTAVCTNTPNGTWARQSGRCVPRPQPSPSPAKSSTWGHWGFDLQNTRHNANETAISPATAGTLVPSWSFEAGGDVSATPTVVGGRLYVPDWAGNLWCLDAVTGAQVWRRRIIDYVLAVDPNPFNGTYTNSSIISRTSPAISGTTAVLGVMKKGGGFAFLLAVSVRDGSLKWGIRADPHPAALVTQSPTIYKGHAYVGVSSLEELQADKPGYPCCTFSSSFVKVSLATGAVVWRTYMTPPNGGMTGGFSGNSIWGSSPAIDTRRQQVYITTGNNYEVPDNLTDCLQQIGNLMDPSTLQAQLECEARFGIKNYRNTILALDLATGKVNWARPIGAVDAWNAACLFGNNPDACPDLGSPDYDFGQAPMLIKACKPGDPNECRQLVVAGQKSGWVWALNPDDGALVWSRQAGPGGLVGGLQWGSASDGVRIYVSNNNMNEVVVDLTKMNAVPNARGATAPPTTTNGGLAAALDAWDGTLLWTFANPTTHWADEGVTDGTARRAKSQAPVTVANGVVFYSSMDRQGTVFFLEAATGRLLGSFATGTTCGCGPSVVDGRVYVGSGYLNFALGEPGNKLWALGLPSVP